MIVTGSKHSTQSFGNAPREAKSHDKPASESRALVAVAPIEAAHEPVANFREAPFLAQLIANRDQLPQTRERRRAEPNEAIAAYLATEALTRH